MRVCFFVRAANIATSEDRERGRARNEAIGLTSPLPGGFCFASVGCRGIVTPKKSLQASLLLGEVLIS